MYLNRGPLSLWNAIVVSHDIKDEFVFLKGKLKAKVMIPVQNKGQNDWGSRLKYLLIPGNGLHERDLTRVLIEDTEETGIVLKFLACKDADEANRTYSSK